MNVLVQGDLWDFYVFVIIELSFEESHVNMGIEFGCIRTDFGNIMRLKCLHHLYECVHVNGLNMLIRNSFFGTC